MATALVLCLALASIGCVHDATIGPLFTETPTPGLSASRVYFYRIDPHHSYSMVEIEIDQVTTVHLLDEEYVRLDIGPGQHEIAFRLRRRLGWPSPSWRKQLVRAVGGETSYFEIAVGLTDRATTSVRESDIAGRNPSGTTGEVVTMRLKKAREAVQRIRMTHLHIP